MRPAFSTLSPELKDLVGNAVLALERERSNVWKGRQRSCLIMSILGLVGGAIAGSIVNSDFAFADYANALKWLMVYQVVMGFGFWIAYVIGERRDLHDTAEIIEKLRQQGIDPLDFRAEVIAEVNSKYLGGKL